MLGILDDVLVFLALLVSVGYAAMSLGPKSLRRTLLTALSRLLARAPGPLILRRAAERLAIRASGQGQGTCGGCDSCGSQAPAASTSPRADVSVPITKIGRRAGS
jgi:hypothetical protein